MADPKWTFTMKDTTYLPIDLSIPKALVLGDIEYNARHWTRVFEVAGELVVVIVRQRDPLTRNITIRFESNIELGEEEIDTLRQRVRYEIGADDGLEALRDAQEKDILVKIALNNNAGLRLYANSNTIEAAICSILQQNLDYATFYEILTDFVRSYGVAVPWEPKLYRFPSPEIIAELEIEDWDKYGIGLKANYLGSMTRSTLRNIEIYAYYPIYERGLEGLMQIDGVGDYTARVIMIYAARRYEKAFMDGYVQEILDHKYQLHQVIPLTEFGKWIQRRWPKDPALVLHAHIQDYLPAYVRDYDFSKIGRATD